MNEELKLKSCPWCGGVITYFEGDWNTNLHYFECCNKDCAIQPFHGYFKCEEELTKGIEAWNKRK